MTRDEVVREARSWLGVPYRERGRSRIGIDCIGLLVVVGQAFQVPHVDHADYGAWPDPHHRILRVLGQYLDRAPVDGPLPGTIGVFAEGRLPGHVGFFSEQHGHTHLIHARTGGPVTEQQYRPLGPRRAFRLVALFAFPGLES